jgi:hypothetical protein
VGNFVTCGGQLRHLWWATSSPVVGDFVTCGGQLCTPVVGNFVTCGGQLRHLWWATSSPVNTQFLSSHMETNHPFFYQPISVQTIVPDTSLLSDHFD